VLLYPLYHPAAALYTPSMLKVLEEDFGRIPGLIDRAGVESRPAAAAEPVLAPPAVEEPREAVQLGLF
jgi:DNA polymerase